MSEIKEINATIAALQAAEQNLNEAVWAAMPQYMREIAHNIAVSYGHSWGHLPAGITAAGTLTEIEAATLALLPDDDGILRPAVAKGCEWSRSEYYGSEYCVTHTTGTGRTTIELYPSGIAIIIIHRPAGAGGSAVAEYRYSEACGPRDAGWEKHKSYLCVDDPYNEPLFFQRHADAFYQASECVLGAPDADLPFAISNDSI